MSELALKLINEAYEKKATSLDLGNCGLREIPKEILKLKDFLQHLSFSSWNIENEKVIESTNALARNSVSDNIDSFAVLLELRNLTSLSLNTNRIREKGAEYISRLRALTSLSLDRNMIGDKGAEYISRLSSLTSLYLGSNKIEDKGAEYISRLSSLTSLNLDINWVGEKGAEYISRLPSLTSLNLRSNLIGDKGAEHIGRLSSLTNLNLSFNSIEEKGAKKISDLISLTSLNLDYNSIGEKGAEYVSSLTSLTSLSIIANFIREDGAKYISRLPSLTSLNLYINSLGPRGAEYISNLSSLTSLNIDNNNIGNEGAAFISMLSSLTSLSISSNEIRAKGAEFISRLSSLTTLEMHTNNIGYKGAEYLSKLSSLNSLSLYGNSIGDKGTEYISRLNSLTSLDLDNNLISERGLEYISKLSALTLLSLSNNNIDDKGAEYISRLSSLTFLNLSSNNIGEKGVEYISKLSSLTSLILNNSNIGEEEAKYIRRLSSLKSLKLNGNKIRNNGAEHISNLSSLTQLELSGNSIGSRGAEYLSRLLLLSSLNLAGNNIDEKGAEFISRLSTLESLNLESNDIGDKGTEFISKLSCIYDLNLSNNKISKIKFNAFNSLGTLALRYNLLETISLDLIKHVNLEIDLEEQKYPLQKILLFGNPIKNPPSEVIQKGRLAILEYLEGNLRPLNECKLIFVGDGSVGKTSLMKRLVYGEFNSSEITTHGINKIAWKGFKNEKDEPIKVNLWDFGGQHIQHSLHQFFFTERVVYVLVMSPRNDEKAGYWLDQVDKLGRNSQIIIVYNWKDKEDTKADFLRNFRELKKTYKYLPEPIVLSCATGDGMPAFIAAVESAVLANEGLKTKYPETWFNIKEKLETRIPIEKHYIKYPQYEEWCAEEQYNDPERRQNLLRILDSVGSIVFFDKPVLNELQVLNPEWISTGAYAIITSEITREKKGHLTWADLCVIFSKEKEIFSDKSIKIKYKEPQFKFILQLMLDYRLCQENPLTDHEYLIPSAFGEKPKKEYEISNGRHYRLKFQSPFEMLIIHRFIAKNILNIVSNDYWNSGIYFKHAGSKTYALVDTNQYSQVIDCWIQGENIRGMWEVIRNDFREIYNIYHNFPVDEEVEYTTDQRTVFLKYDEMIGALNNGVTIIQYDAKTGLKDIDVHFVLELFESPHQTYKKMDDNRIKVEVNPHITINPNFTNNPVINNNHVDSETPKAQAQATGHDLLTENIKTKKWKNKSLIVFSISFIITVPLVLAWANKWIIGVENWNWLEKNGVVNLMGIILAAAWTGLIIKSIYDRFLDPTKEKAYREIQRK